MVIFQHDGVKFACTTKQRNALNLLMESRTGFATVHGYMSTSGRISAETSDINFIAKFSYANLYSRKRKFLENVTIESIAEAINKQPKLSATDPVILAAEFEVRVAKEIESIDVTASGDRSDARRAAHDRCYGKLGRGLKVHYKTVKGADGTMPVLIDGIPIADSIMLSIIEIGRKVVHSGEFKKVNSGIPVLLSQAIKSIMPKGLIIKTLSLKDDNFLTLSIDNNVILSENMKSLL